MKLITFEVTTSIGTFRRVGALWGDRVVDLNATYATYLKDVEHAPNWRELAEATVPADMIRFLTVGEGAMRAARTCLDHLKLLSVSEPLGQGGEHLAYELTKVKVKAPLPRPNSIRDYLSFEEHASNSGKRQLPPAWYELPVCYKGNPASVIGPEEEVLWPGFTDLLDYELEFGIFIGKEGRNIPKELAHEYIAGYTIFNDISARDIQMREMSTGMGPNKGKDTCSVMGPCLVTPDEIDPTNLRMIARVNGEVWSDGNSGTMYWTWGDIIEFASMDETLYPGDFLGSGTVGRGCGSEHGKWIQPGDVIELEIEGIGVLRNTVGPKQPARRFR